MDVSKLIDVKNKMIELENNGDEDMINLKTFLMYEVRGQCTAVAVISTSFPYFGVKLSCVCLIIAYRKKLPKVTQR